MKAFKTSIILISIIILCTGCTVKKNEQAPKPNFVLIFTDDQGYEDLGCFGSNRVSTPRIDGMAEEGMKLTSFYVAAPVCTPSRAALMTGSYPSRIGMAKGSHHAVLLAGDEKGLNPEEITIADVLKSEGYKTGIFGKWHLGDQPEFLPTRQGFDEFFGIPYSHDIHPFHPAQDHYNFPPLPLLDGEQVIEMDPDADYLTRRITERAVQFIEANKDQPFFLYIPHPIPHRPLHMSPPFMDQVPDDIISILEEEGDSIDYPTRDLIYPQAISEIDWSVGQILDALKEQGLDDNTLVLFTSDNGPSISGSAKPLRGKKGSTFEGGMREPTVIRWPGRIPAGEANNELLTAMDLLPTFARLAGAELPADRVLDGRDIWPVLRGQERSPHQAFFYHRLDELQAVRSGNWKLHVSDGKAVSLFDLESDIGESNNVLEENLDTVSRLLQLIEKFEKDLKENSRPAAFVDQPKPLMPDSVSFSYVEISGIGRDSLYNRRDPSDIIKVGNKYYIWYTRMDSPITPGYWGTIWYATSEDEGYTWKEQGMALGTGDDGAFDSHAVFTPNILAYKGKYYLYYTGVKPTPGNPEKEFENNSETDITAIGVAVADTPDGPFVRTKNNPVLTISEEPTAFDSYRIDDASLLVRDGKIWLYYKGRSIIHGKKGPGLTKMGVAFAEGPDGPFEKHGDPILDKSHEVLIWDQNGGVASLASINHSINFAPDGVEFRLLHSNLSNIPKAPGLYRPEVENGNITIPIPGWGISMNQKRGLAYLLRFEMKQ